MVPGFPSAGRGLSSASRHLSAPGLPCMLGSGDMSPWDQAQPRSPGPSVLPDTQVAREPWLTRAPALAVWGVGQAALGSVLLLGSPAGDRGDEWAAPPSRV